MNGSAGALTLAEFDVVGVSVGGALVSGALSLVGPYLAGLTGALAALTLAGWAALLHQAPSRRTHRLPTPEVTALVSVVLGAGIFLGGPNGVAPFRGLVLAVSLIPVWMVARRSSTRGA
ncbi:MAG: hypothetical protein L3K10_04805 [Thermoplasmata archaeon]|nr:hypothetical protein [Thermoplasmata archaeon]